MAGKSGSSSEPNKHEIELPFEWAAKKLLGPTIDLVGADLASVYAKGRDKIIKSGSDKVTNLEDGAKSNLRVTRDVFWNGAFSDDDMCAEYFGGILAGSRSSDGKDDSGVFYLDIIKSLSSSQLKLHYLIYSSFNRLLVEENTEAFNPGLSTDLNKKKIYLLTYELTELGIKYDFDLQALYKTGLLKRFEYGKHISADNLRHSIVVTPTTLGIQLFAVASNRLDDWRKFKDSIFDNFAYQIELEHVSFKPLSANKII